MNISSKENQQVADFEDPYREMPVLLSCFVFFCSVIFFIFMIFTIFYYIAFKKSKRVGPVTRIPIIPFNQDDFYVFEGTRYMKNVLPEVKIQCSEDIDIMGIYCAPTIDIMNSIMRRMFDLDNVLPDEYEEISGQNGQRYYRKKPKISVPRNARTISIKMENFKHGLKCHDFEPIDGISPESYYTYQMFGDNRIQVTNYVENGITYVAGFCIYIRSPSDSGVYYREEVILDCLNSQKYPRRSHNFAPQRTNVTTIDLETFNEFEQQSSEAEIGIPCEQGCSGEERASNFYQISHQNEVPIEQMTIKYCPNLQRNVMSGLKTGIVIHQEWDKDKKMMMNEECEMCTELLNNEEPPPYSSLSLP